MLVLLLNYVGIVVKIVLLLLNYVVLRALWKIDVHLISTLVNKKSLLLLLLLLLCELCANSINSVVLNNGISVDHQTYHVFFLNKRFFCYIIKTKNSYSMHYGLLIHICVLVSFMFRFSVSILFSSYRA